MIGFLVVGFALVVALVGPLLVDADPFEFGYGTGLPPSSEHLLGHDGARARTCSHSSSTACARASRWAR